MTFANALPQKNLAALVLFALLANLIIGGVLLPYRAAQAVWLVSDIITHIKDAAKLAWEKIRTAYADAAAWISANKDTWEMADTWYMRALKAAFNILRKKLLDMLVDDIVQWIQGGGKPRFITDWGGFLSQVADQAGGQFLDKYLGLGFLCKSFAPQLRYALTKPKGFGESVKCTLSDMGENINQFFNDFSNGGWDRWTQITQSQNNFYGTYLTMQDAMWNEQTAAGQAAKNEGIASAGFLGDKVCTKRYCPNAETGELKAEYGLWKPEEVAPCQCDQRSWDITTPGKVVADTLSKAAGVDIDYLISSKEFSEYLGAILDAVINRIIGEGVAMMKTSGGSSGHSGSGISYAATPSIINLSTYETALADSGNALALIDQEKLLKENLQSYQKQQQATLDLLKQVQDSQNGALSILNNLALAKCSLPSGVTQASLGTQTTGSCSGTTCPCQSTKTATSKIIAPEVGEIITKENSFVIYETNPQTQTCALVPTPNETVVTNAPIAEKPIAQISDGLAETQSRLKGLDAAIADMENYYQATVNYMEAYEISQRGGAMASSTLPVAEAEMWTAKNKATASTQVIIGSSSMELSELLQDIQNLSTQIVQQGGELQTKRGTVSDCEQAETGTYYKDLCASNAKKIEFQSAYSGCLGQ